MFVELTKNVAEKLKDDLKREGINFEPSQNGSLIHIEITDSLTSQDIAGINEKIDEYIREEGLSLKGNEFNKEAFIYENNYSERE